MAGVTTEPSEVWVRPSGAMDAMPVWGVRGGMLVGLSPMGGPRGLIRIYTPYLGQPAGRVMNFIAVEPVVNGVRCLSELERSHLDGKAGLKMWSADAVDLEHPPVDTATPARGVVDGAALSVYVCVEPFLNEAHVIVKITFHSDRPHEVSLSTFAAGDSKPMEACVLTATMGNFARLRHLHLRDRTIEAAELFRAAAVNSVGFFDWHEWPASELQGSDGEIFVSATGDADDPELAAGVPRGWQYVGKPAVQSWRTAVRANAEVRVNGRRTFWATDATIPGGAAFENFEIYEPFAAGEIFRFGVEEE